MLNKNEEVILDNVIIKNNIDSNVKLAMYKEVNGNYTEYESDTFPLETHTLNTNESKCTNNKGNIIDNVIEYDSTNNKIKIRTNKSIYCYLYFDIKELIYTFDYTGSEQEFKVPYTGTYKVELWGAQGGDAKCNVSGTVGGYGAYSIGETTMLTLR